MTDTTQLSVSEALGEHAANPSTPAPPETTIFSLDREWKVSAVEQRIMAQFEQWLLKNGMKSITDCERFARLADTNEDRQSWLEEAASQRTAFMHARAAGKYDWQGEVWRSAITDIPGTRYMLFLLLQRCHPDMTHELAIKISKGNPKDTGAAVAWAMGNDLALASGAKNGKPAKD